MDDNVKETGQDQAVEPTQVEEGTEPFYAEEKEEEYPRPITEEMGVHKEWYEQASKVKTPGALADFVYSLIHDYHHDYGTIVHACTAAAIAACWTVDGDPKQGGITGFQASCIMWEFIMKWMHKDGPLRLTEFERMLYPQYAENFAHAISEDTWKWLQEEAQKKLDTTPDAHPDIVEHWKLILNGVVPFGYEVKKEEA